MKIRPSKSPRTRSGSAHRRSAANPAATSTSVARAFAILEALSLHGETGAALMETADRVRMSKSTTHRYLMTLEKLGAIERDGNDRFHLGLKMIELAGQTLSNNDLRKLAEPVLNDLAARTQETVHLAVPSGTDVVYIAKADSAQAIRMYSHIGARAPMYCTALGKAILAYAAQSLVDQVVRTGLRPRTPYSITNHAALLGELARIRSQGFAIDDQENELGVCCVGTPILDYSARSIGAISVSGPADRVTRARQFELGPLLREAGLLLSRRMGYSWPPPVPPK